VPIEFFYEGVPEEGGTGRGRSSAAAVPDVSTFLATSDAVDLMKAFVQIKDRGVRRRIVKLAEELAKGETSVKAAPKAASKGTAAKATARQRKR